MLDVSGKSSKLWHYIWFDPLNERLTNQRLGEFFHSFNIMYNEQNTTESWQGKEGGVRVKHTEYEGRTVARVAFCLTREYQKRLPKWRDKPSSFESNPAPDNGIGEPVTTGNARMSFEDWRFDV